MIHNLFAEIFLDIHKDFAKTATDSELDKYYDAYKPSGYDKLAKKFIEDTKKNKNIKHFKNFDFEICDDHFKIDDFEFYMKKELVTVIKTDKSYKIMSVNRCSEYDTYEIIEIFLGKVKLSIFMYNDEDIENLQEKTLNLGENEEIKLKDHIIAYLGLI